MLLEDEDMEVMPIIEGMAEVAGVPTTFAGGIKLAGQAVTSYISSCRQQRAKNFLNCLDLRCDYLTPEAVQKLQAFIESPEGQDIFEQAIEVVTRTVSKVIPMAMALILLEDPDYTIGKEQKLNLINGLTGASDPLIDFFIELQQNHSFREVEPYRQYFFGSYYGLTGVFAKYKPEQIYSYIQQLINRSLLLPNPQIESGLLLTGEGWSVTYGVSDEQSKTMALFGKAKIILATL